MLTFGRYPDVSLAEARERRREARRLLHDGVDPARRRDEERRAVLAATNNTFEILAREWHAVKAKSWTDAYARNVLHRLELDIFPEVGRTAIDEITHRQMIVTLRKIEERGAHEIAKREKAVCSQIFSYAIQSGIATRNPIVDMRDILQRVTPGNFPAIDADQLPAFLDAMRRNEACMNPATRMRQGVAVRRRSRTCFPESEGKDRDGTSTKKERSPQ